VIRTRSVQEADGKVSELSYDRSWNRRLTDGGTSEVQTFYVFPLSPGRTWTGNWSYRLADGGRGRISLAFSAEAPEIVTVRAGTFQAVPIRAVGNWQHEGKARRGRSEYVSWYSPQARRWVRFDRRVFAEDGSLDSHESTELVEYSLRP
jgi:hypothetical protein